MPIFSNTCVSYIPGGTSAQTTRQEDDDTEVAEEETLPLSGDACDDGIQEFLRTLILGSKRGSMSVRPWRMVTFDEASLSETQKESDSRKSLTKQRSSVLGSRRGSKCLKRQGVKFDICLIDDESQSSERAGPFARASITGQRSEILGSRRGSKCLKRSGVKFNVRFVHDGPHISEEEGHSTARVSLTKQRSLILGSRRGSISGGRRSQRVSDETTHEKSKPFAGVSEAVGESTADTLAFIHGCDGVDPEAPGKSAPEQAVSGRGATHTPRNNFPQKPRGKKPSTGGSSSMLNFDYSVWLSLEGSPGVEAQLVGTGDAGQNVGAVLVPSDDSAVKEYSVQESAALTLVSGEGEGGHVGGSAAVSGQATVSPEEHRELLTLPLVQQGAREGPRAAALVGSPGKLLSSVLGTFCAPWKRGGFIGGGRRAEGGNSVCSTSVWEVTQGFLLSGKGGESARAAV